jgi:hypothetical protein
MEKAVVFGVSVTFLVVVAAAGLRIFLTRQLGREPSI